MKPYLILLAACDIVTHFCVAEFVPFKYSGAKYSSTGLNEKNSTGIKIKSFLQKEMEHQNQYCINVNGLHFIKLKSGKVNLKKEKVVFN